MLKTLNIEYAEFHSMEEMQPSDAELLRKAIEATGSSYSPYSHYPVGAAVRMSDGRTAIGANQENAAFPSGLCAERTAIFSAHANYPDTAIEAIAIVSASNGTMTEEPAFPCGACRQVMAESQKRAGAPIRIIIGSASGIYVFKNVESLLPFIFNAI